MAGWIRMLLAAAAAVTALAVPALAQKRVALLIGNDSYHHIPGLRKAVNDARTMGDTLKKLGFQVVVAQDLSRKDMIERLAAFDQFVDKGDVVFFFFSGHGFEVKGENYLLPTDVPAAKYGQEELLRDAAIPAARIVDRFQARGARTAILVLDACRNNPFDQPGTRAVAGGGGLAAMQPPEGVFVVFSAGAKQTALDRLSDRDASPNSVFTRYFAEELAKPGQTLVQIAKRTQAGVKSLAGTIGHNQTPAYYDQIVGDVVLHGSADAAPPQPIGPVAALPPQPKVTRDHPDEPVNGPLVTFMNSSGGWSASLSFADPVGAISYRIGESGAFRETGFLDALDPRTRKRMPNPSFQFDADQGATTIYVRAIDRNGDEMGPFPVKFEPLAALARSQRKILDMTAGSWLSFRDFQGVLLYYTHLVSYRCAIREVRIGIDTQMPDKVLPLPPCDPKNPSAIDTKMPLYLKMAPTTKSVSVELTYRDGSVSELKTFRR